MLAGRLVGRILAGDKDRQRCVSEHHEEVLARRRVCEGEVVLPDGGDEQLALQVEEVVMISNGAAVRIVCNCVAVCDHGPHLCAGGDAGCLYFFEIDRERDGIVAAVPGHAVDDVVVGRIGEKKDFRDRPVVSHRGQTAVEGGRRA
ncbi:hypothetical protein FQZ97_754760 [compost metagenome]